MLHSKSRHVGFTLIELLVVVAIIALLIAILLPSLARAKKLTQATRCLSNLRQLVVAAYSYTHSSRDRYPITYYLNDFSRPPAAIIRDWDFKKTIINGITQVQPGHLWMGKTNVEVQQCPVFLGSANSPGDPFTGYNYNTSYIGHGMGESIQAPAQVTDVRRPTECALFGDGEYLDGANKRMRAPDQNDGDASFTGRYSGTQGYRHLDKTNVAFADGHAEAWRYRFMGFFEDDIVNVKNAPGTGFLSSDNRLYDLK